MIQKWAETPPGAGESGRVLQGSQAGKLNDEQPIHLQGSIRRVAASEVEKCSRQRRSKTGGMKC